MASQAQGRAPVRILTTSGVQFLTGLSDGDATTVARHWNGIRLYLDTGNTNGLTHSAGRTVTGRDPDGQQQRVALETDPDRIEWAALRGDVRFDSIYDEVQ